MKIEIWSDVVCPFCYIGKRKFETALQQFPQANEIQVVWKSFQLDPHSKTDTDTNIHQYLARHKGISLAEAEEMNNYVTEMARNVGLHYDFDNAVVANTFNAHRLIHFSKSFGKQGETKEALLRAYFTEGRNIDDISILTTIAENLKMDAEAARDTLESGRFAEEVKSDIYEAQQLGIRGVPFFVLNRKYGISGAQEPPVFLQALEKSFAEWREKNPESSLDVIGGKSCSTDGSCD